VLAFFNILGVKSKTSEAGKDFFSSFAIVPKIATALSLGREPRSSTLRTVPSV
jgi:hypothetical protein